ncbi:hypothetical protein HanIR_Chr12g0588391 [Helianthus annuus]|nr:hypothetical protein HanIR_Chr12g0588391 [Helianthus annuus]
MFRRSRRFGTLSEKRESEATATVSDNRFSFNTLDFSILTRALLTRNRNAINVDYSRIKKQARMALETHFSILVNVELCLFI